MKHWLILENKKQYEAALKRINDLMDVNPGPKTNAGKEMKLLLFLVEKYEDEHYPIGLPDPIEAIKTRMEDLGLDAKDLVAAIGDKGTVSKVLNRRIPLSLRMIRNLSEKLQLPADVLIQEGKLVVAA
jgi:HTH-type transcriptional regulator/antitoxin HigA